MLARCLSSALGARSRWPQQICHRALSALTPAPEPLSVSGASIRLREYQEECIQAVLTYLEKGHRRLGISLATGSGKTVIFTHLIERIKPSKDDATQTLILVHRRELVEQAALHCARTYPSKVVEIEMGRTHASGQADITIASILSITSKDRIVKYDPDKFKLILVDEAHHVVAKSFMNALTHFRLLPSEGLAVDHSPVLVGVSATLSRFDGLRLSDVIDHIVYHKDYVDLIEEGWLSKVIFTTVKSNANISRVRKASSGDFQVGDLSKAVNTHESNEITVRAWMARATCRKSTLVFCVDLAHVSDLTAKFREYGFDARFITGDTPKQIRSERLDAFRAGKFPILLSVGVFTEGTDIPNIDCVLLARPTRSRNLLTQMIGRGMRLSQGKTNCHVIDMVAALGTGIVTTPTLFGLDPAEMVDEANLEDMKSLHDRKENETVREQRAKDTDLRKFPREKENDDSIITFTDYDSVYALIDDTSGERHIRGMSPLTWVMVGLDRYILSSQDGSYLTIERDEADSTYSVTHTQKMTEELREANNTKSPFMRPRSIAKSDTLADAVHAADTFASKRFPWHFVQAGQPWRKKPATEGQLAFINKLRPMEDQLTQNMLSKGRAMDMISKLKFGAKGHFNKLDMTRKKHEKEMNKQKQMDVLRQRESVQVGPMA